MAGHSTQLPRTGTSRTPTVWPFPWPWSAKLWTWRSARHQLQPERPAGLPFRSHRGWWTHPQLCVPAFSVLCKLRGQTETVRSQPHSTTTWRPTGGLVTCTLYTEHTLTNFGGSNKKDYRNTLRQLPSRSSSTTLNLNKAPQSPHKPFGSLRLQTDGVMRSSDAKLATLLLSWKLTQARASRGRRDFAHVFGRATSLNKTSHVTWFGGRWWVFWGTWKGRRGRGLINRQVVSSWKATFPFANHTKFVCQPTVLLLSHADSFAEYISFL